MNFMKMALNFRQAGATKTMSSTDCGVRKMGMSKMLFALAALGTLALGSLPQASAQTAPPYVVYSTTALSGPGSSNAGANFGGFRGHPAFNSRGDLFMSDGSGQHVYEYPANGGDAFLVFTDTNGNQFSGVAVDPSDNLFIGVFSYNGPNQNNDQNSLLYEFPSTNGTYEGLPYIFNSNAVPGSCLPAVPATPTTPATAANTTVCSVGFYVGAIYYYWQGPFDTTVDGQGNVYSISGYLSQDQSDAKEIVQCQIFCAEQIPGNGATDYTVVVPNSIQSIATDYAGNLFSADNTNVYLIPAGSPASKNTPAIWDSTYNQPYGVSFDPSGNLYVTDEVGIWEVPSLEAGGTPCKGGTDACTLTASSKYLLLPGALGHTAGLYSAYLAPAIDNHGHIVFTTSYNSVYEYNLWSGSFPSSVIGTPAQIGNSGSTALGFTVSFDTATTLSSVTAVQGSLPSTEFTVTPGTCTAGSTFEANSTCTFSASFTPSGLGTRTADIVITDATGKSTNTYITGIGIGTGVSVDPGTPNQIAAGLQKAAGIAIDNSGNLYVADSTANTVQEYPVGGGPVVSIGTGLNTPTGVAVDGGGNVYIVNQGAGTVVEVPSVAGVLTNSAQMPLVSGLNMPTDIIVDGNGNLYVTATGSNQVLQLASASRDSASAAIIPRGYGFNAPTGLALDPSGNIFVADTGNNQVVELGDGYQVAVGSGLTAPTGVTTDPSGSVIIADGTGRLIRVPNESFGTSAIGLNTADQQVLSSPLYYPYSVRTDNTGNLYVSDNNVNVVDQLQRTTGTLNFGDWNVNTVSDTQTIVLSNIGTMDVTIGNPPFAPVPVASEFTVETGSGPTGCAPGLFHSGYNCSVTSNFEPTVGGPSNYPLVFNAPAQNTAAPTVNLTGTGVGEAAVTIQLSQTLPTTPTISYGQEVVITATVTAPAGVMQQPMGLVVFSFDGQDQRPAMLMGVPNTFSATASITLNGLNAGSNTLSAFYTGSPEFGAVNSTVLPLTILQATSTNTLIVVGDSADPLSVQPGDTITFTDVLAPSVVGDFAGTVNFIDVATGLPLNPSPIRLVAPSTMAPYVGDYVVSYSFQPQAHNPTIGLGDHSVVAVYSGNTNYSADNSVTIGYTVIVSTYTLTPDKTSVTAAASAPGIVNIVVTDYSKFEGNVSLQCSGLPANAYCVFRPASAQLLPAPGALPNTQLSPLTIYPVPVVLQIIVDTSIVPIESASMFWIGAIVLGLAFAWRRKIKSGTFGMASLAGVICLAGLVALGGCSSSKSYPTPSGNYVVTVTGTATPYTSGGNLPNCSYMTCTLPYNPVTNPSINVVKTFAVNLTVK